MKDRWENVRVKDPDYTDILLPLRRKVKPKEAKKQEKRK